MSVDVLAVTSKASWEEAQLILGTPPVDPDSIRTLFAKRILAAAGKGERDPKRLRVIALGAVEA